MQPRAMDFVYYGVTSLEKATPFYRDTLGLKPLGKPFDGKWLEFELGGATLAIGEPPYGQPPKGGDQEGGATVAIAVRDVRATAEELKAKGVPVTWGPEETGTCVMASIKDPDGNTLMLHQRKDGTAG
jgi:predicted enzyme related to lactoylglutathione lyase